MIVHLGRRVSALLDGQLSPSETERAWQHVHLCHPCRDLVEREGRIKTQLAGLAGERNAAPSYLKGSLLGQISAMAPAFPEESAATLGHTQQRVTLALIGTGALSVVMLGAFALTVQQGASGLMDRRLPLSDFAASAAPRPDATPPATGAQPTVTNAVISITEPKAGVSPHRAAHRVAPRGAHTVQ